MDIVERFALKLRSAIEAHKRTNDHVTNPKLLADPSSRTSGNYDFWLHLADDLIPQIYIRSFGPSCDICGIGLEDDNAPSPDFGGPI